MGCTGETPSVRQVRDKQASKEEGRSESNPEKLGGRNRWKSLLSQPKLLQLEFSSVLKLSRKQSTSSADPLSTKEEITCSTKISAPPRNNVSASSMITIYYSTVIFILLLSLYTFVYAFSLGQCCYHWQSPDEFINRRKLFRIDDRSAPFGVASCPIKPSDGRGQHFQFPFVM